MTLNQLPILPLILQVIINILVLLHIRSSEGCLRLHVDQGRVDAEISWHESGPGEDQTPAQAFSGSLVHLESHVAFPEIENFGVYVEFEEFHGS